MYQNINEGKNECTHTLQKSHMAEKLFFSGSLNYLFSFVRLFMVRVPVEGFMKKVEVQFRETKISVEVKFQ